MSQPITVLVYAPDFATGVETTLTSLEAIREVVGGWLEQHLLANFVSGVDHRLLLVCNKDGRTQGLRKNRLGILGTFFICRAQGSELTSVTEDDVKAVRRLLDVFGPN